MDASRKGRRKRKKHRTKVKELGEAQLFRGKQRNLLTTILLGFPSSFILGCFLQYLPSAPSLLLLRDIIVKPMSSSVDPATFWACVSGRIPVTSHLMFPPQPGFLDSGSEVPVILTALIPRVEPSS